MFGDRLVNAFREFKTIWDPGGKMNPGKMVDPYPLDSNLRTGPDYKPKPVLTIFQFPDDRGSMAAATERCFGVGKCRKLEGGTMCPSFQVRREEQHSTRGRARMLFEMLRGDVIDDGWRDPHVKEALDLCLACKGCKGDCPVSVDVATYKAEFLAHYYEGRTRPAAAYSMGLIDKWAQIGSRTPALANIAIQTPGFAALARKLGGVAPHRALPALRHAMHLAEVLQMGLRPQQGRSKRHYIEDGNVEPVHRSSVTALLTLGAVAAAGTYLLSRKRRR